ncbi:MAG: xanthine dehydrogenase family protein molybdopterin-binding subunit [Janthinobacterium lividum]
MAANGEPRSPGRQARLGQPEVRIDGPAKVCGSAQYPGDVRLSRQAYGVLVTSPVARGRIARLDRTTALAMPGVLDVLTYQNMANRVRHVGHALDDGWANSTLRPLASAEISYAGQIVAMVVADTLEQAQHAAHGLRIDYEAGPHVASLDDLGARAESLAAIKKDYKDRYLGDVASGLAESTVVVDEHYATPIQHHNPIELPTTTCVWDGDRLTVYEPSRFVGAVKNGLAAQLGIDPADIRVVAKFIGGHFGSKLALSQHTVLAALAAKRLDRPVTIATSRRDSFTIANHRTETRHHIRLGADAAGKFMALSHTGETATSRFDTFAMEGTDVTTALYACPNIAGEERLARVDRNTPGPMRAPPEVPYLFALESAVDELANQLRIDPIELRRRNDTAGDPVTGHGFTTRPLVRCFDQGAAAFGWAQRPTSPRSRQEGGWWIGYGCAAAARPVKIGAAVIRVTISADGAVLVETAHHEIGNGLYTLLAMTASERLAAPLDRVTVALGDTVLPPAGISGGSSTSTTLVNALAQACEQLRGGSTAPRSVTVDYLPEGAEPTMVDEVKQGHSKLVSLPKDRLAWAFGAHFIEVAVHAQTGEARVRRHTGAFAAGRILNPLAARSQFLGGMIWGQSAALLEATELDPRSGAYLNRDLADYLVPTSADISRLDVVMVEDDDHEVNLEGIKGLGEIGIIGVNAAVANAVFNAVGVRIRSLPIRVEDLMRSAS